MRRELIVIAVLVIAIAFMIGVIEFYKKNVEQADAKKFVIEELKDKYPLADLEIINVNEKFNENGEKYYEIKAKVTNNAAGACPERMHIYFNYPEQNFVSQPPEYITKDCMVCLESANCPVMFKEEAIIVSHTGAGTGQIDDFINGNMGAYPTVTEGEGVWIVVWDSPLSNYYYEVTVSKNASIVKIEKKSKGLE